MCIGSLTSLLSFENVRARSSTSENKPISSAFSAFS
uniref:Uncharacterized protein n=1 Tax=Arundo donax TaxID=35708 RepID=A0A0A9C4Q2_ARUDO